MRDRGDNSADIRAKGAAGVDASPSREIADQPSLSPTAGGREAAAVQGAAQSTEKLKKRPLSSRAVHFIVVALLFALGIGLLWLTISAYTTDEALQREALQLLRQFFPFWRPTTQVAFLIAFGILFSRIARNTALYPLVVFLVSLQAVEQISEEIIDNGGQPLLDTIKQIFFVNDLTLYMFIVGLYTLFFAAATVFIGGSLAGAAVVEDERRRRIKAYFESRPIWPWVVSGLAVILALYSITGQFKAREQLFLQWKQTLIGLSFGVSVIWLLFDDRKRQSFYYFNLFIVLFLACSQVLNYLTGYPYAMRDNWVTEYNNLTEQQKAQANELYDLLDTFYTKYWLAFAALTMAYAGIFRLLIFPRFHLATDAEVDACIAEDLKPAMSKAFARFGFERSGLIAEPLSLRNFPNRSNISGAFIGSWIGDDDRLRFTPQTATVIAFAEEQVMFSDMTVDLTTGTIVNETMSEFFYQDICNVSRVSTTQLVDVSNARSFIGRLLSIFSRTQANREQQISGKTVNDKLQLPGRDVFQISLNNGSYLLVVLRDTTFFDVKKKRVVQILTGIISAARTPQADPDMDLPTDENERMVRNIRSMLRDKKRALLLEQR